MRVSLSRIFLPLFFLLSLSPLSANDAPHQAVAAHFEMERDNGTPLVEVQFSDTVSGLFAIDTGAYDSVMTADMAKRLGSKQDVSPERLLESVSGYSFAVPTFVHVPSLTIAKVHVTNLDFQVAPNYSFDKQNDRPIDGLIGGTLLSHFALLLDYPRRTMVWIHPGNLNDQAVADLGLDPKNAIGLHQELGSRMGYKVNHYSASVHLESGGRQRTEEMFIDTGAPGSSISVETARRLALVSQKTQPYRFVFQAPDLGCVGPVPIFHLGPLALSNVQVLYPSHIGAKMVSLIGENVLGNCVALLDFGPHRFYLKPVLPGLTADPPPAYDARTVDWERLRKAPDAPDFSEILGRGLSAEALDGVPQKVARLKEAMTGKSDDAERYEQIGLLLRGAKDPTGAEAALSQAVAFCRREAEAHPDDPERAAYWTEALMRVGENEEALAAAQKNTVRWPKSSLTWRVLGQAQENRAACLLLGEWGKPVTEEQILDPFANVSQLPDKPEPARVQQIGGLRLGARDSYNKSVALAPLDPVSYRSRACFWVLEGWLLALMQDLEVKGQSPSTDVTLAAALSDCQNELRLSRNDPDLLRRAVVLDFAWSVFHDGDWIRVHLHGVGQKMEMAKDDLMTAKSAQARLVLLSQSPDKSLAASALEALGRAQASQNDPASEATLRQAITLDPTRVAALATVASRLVTENRLADLRNLLTTEAARNDTLPIRLLLSVTLSALGQAEDAETQVRLALKSEPDNPTANRMLTSLLLARSGYDYAILAEVPVCLSKAKTGYGALAPPLQKTGLQTMQAVWLALTSDPAGARQQLISLAKEEPTSTQVREALSAMTIPPDAP